MGDRRQKRLNIIILVLLFVGLVWSVAVADHTGWIGGTARAEGATDSREADGAAGSSEQTVRQKVSRLSEKKHVENGGQRAGEKGQSQPAATVLAVTDLRINNPAVKEYADKETFLMEYGFDGRDPYFEYFTEDGALQLELYYDESFGVGCGLRYYPGEDLEPKGFLFNGSRNYRYYSDFMKSGGIETDQYSAQSFDGSDGKEGVEDYEESFIYREDGRPAHYVSQGWATYLTDKKESSRILQIDWSYREDGTLQKRDYWHNGMIFGTWYSSRQSYYDEQERLIHEHCYVTHGSVDYYYIYEGKSEIPSYCLIIDNNLNLICAELLEYHGAETEMYHGRIGPMLVGESENRYAAAVIEAAEEKGKDYDGYVTHTYAADYDGDGMEEAFVILGKEIKNEYEYDIIGDCWFVNSDLEVSRCVERACAFSMSQQFICQDEVTYLLIRYSIGLPWQGEIYTVRDNAPVEISGSYADKYIDRKGQVIQIENAYDGQCTVMNLGMEPGEDNWKYLWSGHSWKRYTFIFDHGELREIPAREVTREEAEQIAPLPVSFNETAPDSIKQFILRDNGELNINMAVEGDWREGEKNIDFSYITYRLNSDGEWEYVEEQIGYYMIQFSGWENWDYVEELYHRVGTGF